jgi:hypothetical protein
MFSVLVINAAMLCHNNECRVAGIADIVVAAIACNVLLSSLTSSTALAGAAAVMGVAVACVWTKDTQPNRLNYNTQPFQQSYPLEMHLVHFNLGYGDNLYDALVNSKGSSRFSSRFRLKTIRILIHSFKVSNKDGSWVDICQVKFTAQVVNQGPYSQFIFS